MSEYPEHDKLSAVADKTQAIGDFLEWIGTERGARLMVWLEWDEPYEDECDHFTDASALRCKFCKGTRKRTGTRHYERWLPLDGSIQGWLAAWAGIDRDALEREKRAMLDALRARQTGGA